MGSLRKRGIPYVQTTPLSLWLSIRNWAVCRIFKKVRTDVSFLREVVRDAWVSWKSDDCLILLAGAKCISSRFPFYSPIWVKFGTEGLHILPLNSSDFRENRWNGSHVLLKRTNEFLPYIPHLWLTSTKFGKRDGHSNVVSDYKFRKNRRSEHHILL
jgi:hypothetical protein